MPIKRDAATGSSMQIPGFLLYFGADNMRTDVHIQPPELGKQTKEVLSEVGIDDLQIAEFIDEGVAC